MLKTANVADLQGRKTVRVRLRPNLIIAPQLNGDGRAVHVVKDPVGLQYFRLDQKQRFVVSLMDGANTLDQIQQAYEKAFRPDRLSLEELEGFAGELLQSGLAQNESSHAGRLLFERSEKKRRARLWSALASFLCIKIPVFDPDRLLGRMVSRLRPLFTRLCTVLTSAFILAALALVATHWDAFLHRLPTYRELFTAQTFFYLWLALGIVKILHEFGHGLCCKAMGGDVPEMGILLIFFFPALYCDVTDSWRIADKKKRIAIAAAGIYVELIVAAAATILWWASAAGTLVHDLSFSLMIVCSVSTVLLNGNPLLRLDGYYVLSDWLEIPNLAETANRCVQGLVLRWLGVRRALPGTALPTRQGFLICYAVASFCYRCAITFAGLYFLHGILEPYKLGSVAVLLGIGAMVTTLGLPAYRLLRALAPSGRRMEMKIGRLGAAAVVVAGLVTLVLVMPLPTAARGLAVIQVEPEHAQRVVVPDVGGFLEKMVVRDGQHVVAGDVLAVLHNPGVEVSLRLNEADQALRVSQRSAFMAQLAEPGSKEKDYDASLQTSRMELQALVAEHASLKEQLHRLTLRAPRDGVVMGLQPHDQTGRWLEKGTELCHVGDERALRAVLLLEPGDQKLIATGSLATIHVHGAGATSWPGVVTEIAQVEASKIPAALSHRSGGDVATQQDPVTRHEKPSRQHYLVAVHFEKKDRSIHPGVMARVKIHVGPQTLGGRLQRFLATTFNWGW